MENEFVIYEQAVKLKELGFKERVLIYFEDDKVKLHNSLKGWDFNTSFLTCISRPTKSQVFRWFRENHMIDSFINVFTDFKNEKYYVYIIFKNGDGSVSANENSYDDHQEAESECINTLISLIEAKI